MHVSLCYSTLPVKFILQWWKTTKCVPNDVVILDPNQQYVELINWHIRDEIVIDVDTADNSTNNAMFTDYLNEEHKLETNH